VDWNNLISLLEWPAMVVTLISAWLVAAQTKGKRKLGFYTFGVSNVLWVAWGLYADAYALIVLQVGLFLLNLRGVKKNHPEHFQK
jgi:bacteriorhodopsin